MTRTKTREVSQPTSRDAYRIYPSGTPETSTPSEICSGRPLLVVGLKNVMDAPALMQEGNGVCAIDSFVFL